MANLHYTLNDPLFRYAIVKGIDSEGSFDDGRKLMIVGGAASQLKMSTTPELLRPTTDVDVISNNYTTKNQRRAWAQRTQDIISEEGHPAVGSLSRYGSEVRFTTLDQDLLLHLDCFGPNFFNRHKKKIDGEYERADLVNIDGNLVRCHSPMDVIVNKIRRIHSIGRKYVELDPFQRYFLDLVSDAQFDDVDTSSLRDSLKEVLKIRNQTVEDLGRYNYNDVITEIEGYKVAKDIYDISGVIDACRKEGVLIPKKDFKKSLELALED